MAKSVEEQIKEILNEYVDQTNDKIVKNAEEVTDRTVKRLKQTSPRRAGRGKHYRNQWTKKTKKIPAGGIQTVIYNRQYQLTHLLEKGHVVKNQYGTYGRAPAIRHIEPAAQEGNEEFLKRLREEL